MNPHATLAPRCGGIWPSSPSYVKQKIDTMVNKNQLQGYGGIDIALDSDKVCACRFIPEIVAWAKEKYDATYTHNPEAIRQGYCGHHLSIQHNIHIQEAAAGAQRRIVAVRRTARPRTFEPESVAHHDEGI